MFVYLLWKRPDGFGTTSVLEAVYASEESANAEAEKGQRQLDRDLARGEAPRARLTR